MRRRNPGDEEAGLNKEEAALAAWYAKQQHLPYPDDLPIPRRMKYGPQTPEVASQFLNADYPLPGTFAQPSTTTADPAWVHYLQEGQIYPGTKIDENLRADRQVLLYDFAASNYQDAYAARRLLKLDHKTGYSPVFEFQYAVLNFQQWNHVLFFSLNGVNHTLHWNDNNGWNIDGEPFVAADEAFNDFALFDFVAFGLGNPYPVITIKKLYTGDPEAALRGLKKPPSSEFLNRFGVRRNPPEDDLRSNLKMLEQDYFGQPMSVRRGDLKEINELRVQLQMPQVDDQLREVFVVGMAAPPPSPPPPPPPAPPKSPKDPHKDAREIYRAFLEKKAGLQPYQEYCQKMIAATQPGNGMTPVMPLATMGTDGGPLLCDTCGKQIPLEGGSFHNLGAGDAWMRAGNKANSTWHSFIFGGVTFAEDFNRTFRVYHGYENGCMSKDPVSKGRDAFRSNVPYSARQQLDAFLQEEKEITDPAQRKNLIGEIINVIFGFDPGVGINRPS